MNFAQLFSYSNSSVNKLRGNVIRCSVKYTRGEISLVDTGLKRATTCFQDEFNTSLKVQDNGSSCLFGIESVEPCSRASSFSFAPQVVFPKSLDRICKRKLVWIKLSSIWRSHISNRIYGFILNPLNGGYAVAIAGYIAFLPKSLLRRDKQIFHGQWRLFKILNMKVRIKNIVVKEIGPKRAHSRARRKGRLQNKSRNVLWMRSNRGAQKYVAQLKRESTDSYNKVRALAPLSHISRVSPRAYLKASNNTHTGSTAKNTGKNTQSFRRQPQNP